MASPSRIPIKIFVEDVGESRGELILFLAPKTVNMIVKALPLEGKIVKLEGEIYFLTPIKTGVEKGKDTVEPGTIAYWPQANAICIFYEGMRLYGKVNIIGKILENLEVFREAKNSGIIRVEKG